MNQNVIGRRKAANLLANGRLELLNHGVHVGGFLISRMSAYTMATTNRPSVWVTLTYMVLHEGHVGEHGLTLYVMIDPGVRVWGLASHRKKGNK